LGFPTGWLSARISELINPVTDQWDEELLIDHFNLDDIKEILMIPIYPDMEDTIAWHYERKGNFTVKSAYHLGVSLQDSRLHRDGEPSTNAPMQNTTWNDLWKLKLLGKVLVFLWRLTHNSLPTIMNIKRKKIELDTRCPMCWQLDEDR
jgi:hypothetical protein